MENRRNILIGSALIAAAQAIKGLMEVIIKMSSLKIAQFMSARFTIDLILAAIWWNSRKLKKPQDSTATDSNQIIHKNWYGDAPNIGKIWIRGVLNSTYFLTYYSICKLPFGDFTAIYYQGPLFTVLFAWIFLGETLPNLPVFIPSVMMMICGILLVSQPQFVTFIFESDNNKYTPLDISGIITCILSELKWIICVLLVRKAVGAHFTQITFANCISALCLTLPTMLFMNHYYFHVEVLGNLDFDDEEQWQWSWDSFFITALFAVLGFVAIGLSVTGYQYGEATKVSWLEYINIPIGFLCQWLIFQNTPNKYELIGGSLVTIGCLLTPLEQLYKYCNKKEANQEEMANVVSECNALLLEMDQYLQLKTNTVAGNT